MKHSRGCRVIKGRVAAAGAGGRIREWSSTLAGYCWRTSGARQVGRDRLATVLSRSGGKAWGSPKSLLHWGREGGEASAGYGCGGKESQREEERRAEGNVRRSTSLVPLSSAAMSEYWVSKARYYCKYCSIYIADDKPVSSSPTQASRALPDSRRPPPQSRVQHETGLRHKGNYDRYITQIYKKGEKDQRDKAEESREIARMEAVRSSLLSLHSS